MKSSRGQSDSADRHGDRLNKFLASCGLGSRRSCETLISEGRVEINGDPCLTLATRIGEHDSVRVDGRLLRRVRTTTILLNKPRGFLCTRDDPQQRRTIYDLLPSAFHHLHSIGRLDLESCGLLMLTTSGELTEQLTHPRHQIDKEYHVTLGLPFDREHISRLVDGIRLTEGIAKAHSVHILARKRINIVLRQGYNRQLRRMLSTLGYKVKTLERVRIGQLTAPDLSTGDWHLIGKRDIAKVMA